MINSCVSSIGGFLTSPYTSWAPVVIAIAIMMIGVLALMYMLAPLTGKNNIKEWTKVKIFDVLLGIVLIMIFAVFSTTICSVNVAGAYKSAGLMATSCNGAPNVNNLYSVALCNVFQFNNDTRVYMNNIVFGGMMASSFLPEVELSVHMPEMPGLGIAAKIAPSISLTSALSDTLEVTYLLEMLNQVQIYLLGIAPLIFALFMAIGLISRLFGVTRSFGGAMIAFAIGIGFVYPLLASVTYGFLTNTMNNITVNIVSSFWLAIKTATFNLFKALLDGMLIQLGSTPTTTLFGTGVLIPIYQIIEYYGIIAVGLLFIPFINFIILDAFIRDFSSAIGERMDFMSLLTRMI
jgi:hypothetical protein